MALGKIIGKLKMLLSFIIYAAILYGGYLLYQQYQIGGLELVLDYFSTLSPFTLVLIIVVAAMVLAAALSQ